MFSGVTTLTPNSSSEAYALASYALMEMFVAALISSGAMSREHALAAIECAVEHLESGAGQENSEAANIIRKRLLSSTVTLQ